MCTEYLFRKRLNHPSPVLAKQNLYIKYAHIIVELGLRLGPKKENKTVWDTGLSLCADRVLDFVQEMGDLKLALTGLVSPKQSLP